MIEITVVKEEKKTLEKYWVIRAIKDSGKVKTCIKEKECKYQPTVEEIGMFLHESKATFCSVAENYRFVEKVCAW